MDQKMKLCVLAGLLAALLMVPFVLQRGTVNKLRAENTLLQAKVQDLTREHERLSTNAVQLAAKQQSGKPQEQLLELMRLRAEVTALRKLTNAAAGGIPAPKEPQAPAPAVAAAPEAPPVLSTNVPPWNYRGFARPDDTASTMVWAMEQGRLDLLLTSATPEAQAQIQQEYGVVNNPAEKLKADAAGIVEVKPSAIYPPTENEAYISMVINKPAQQVIAEEPIQIGGRTVERGQAYTVGAQVSESVLKLQKVGNEWKFAGKVGK